MTPFVDIRAIGREQRRRLLLGFVALLMMVGHDVLMAGDAHAVSAQLTHASASSTRLDAETEGQTHIAMGRGDCEPAQAAVLRWPDPAPDAADAASSVQPAPANAIIHAVSANDASPTLSPRRRRALLQVYRI